MSETPDYERTASELLRALRGGRSQEALARRLGCRSHAIYTWESGRNYPTAARTFVAAARVGVDVNAALQRFYRRPPVWLGDSDFGAPASVARLLDDLRGKTPVTEIARATGRTRFAVARWLKGQAQPRLPDFLRLIEATSLRLLDFVACLVDPEQMPSIAAAYRDLEATRRAAYEVPWSHAFLRALELQAYKALPAHRPGWLAATLALDRAEEDRSLALLEQSGQIALRDGRYVPTRVTTVDTRRDAHAARRLRQFFSLAAAERVQRAPEGTAASAYNLFGVSRVDLERLRELQRAYFREMRAIIAGSEPVEAVVLANMQLVELSSGESSMPSGRGR
jgi:transcriptional regulator with XRE-family HTH domain